MNMEVEAPFEMLKFTFGFIASMMSTCDPKVADVAWAHFEDNLLNHLRTKRGFDAEGKPISFANALPNGPEEPEEPDNVDSEEPDESDEQDEMNDDDNVVLIEPEEPNEPDECSICLDRKANTLVMPCEHSVVCETCSKDLKNTNDRSVCCHCRNPIDAVYYPDNTVDTVKKN